MAEEQRTLAVPPAPEEDRADRAFYALIFCVVLAIGGYFLIVKLSEMSKIQDCVMAGHNNCAPGEEVGR